MYIYCRSKSWSKTKLVKLKSLLSGSGDTKKRSEVVQLWQQERKESEEDEFFIFKQTS